MFFKKKKPQPEPVWRDFREKTYEELEQEVDAAYGEEMRKRNIKIDIAGFWLRFGFPRIPKRTEQVIDFVSDPVETELPEEEEPYIKYITLEDKDEVDIRKQAAAVLLLKIISSGETISPAANVFFNPPHFLIWGWHGVKCLIKKS